MEQISINSKTSYTETSDSPKIISPSPVRNPTTKISWLIANIALDVPGSLEDLDLNVSSGHFSPVPRRNFSNIHFDNDEFNSDSSNSSSSHLEPEHLSKTNSTISKSSNMSDIFEEMFPDVIPRTSNPIVKDVKFKKYNTNQINYKEGSFGLRFDYSAIETRS